MKQIRFSPWLILVLAVVLVFAAGCDRPDPQVAIDTPQPMNVPQQPVEPQTVGTPVPGGETTCARWRRYTDLAAGDCGDDRRRGRGDPESTPAASGQDTPQLVPTVPPPQPAAAARHRRFNLQLQVNAQGNVVHTVKPGETLFSIGRLYNVNPYSIAAANNIPYPYIIYPGQQLIDSDRHDAAARPRRRFRLNRANAATIIRCGLARICIAFRWPMACPCRRLRPPMAS